VITVQNVNDAVQKILSDYFELLQPLTALKISELLTCKNSVYQLPENFEDTLFLDAKISFFETKILMAFIEKVSPAITFSDDQDKIIIDPVEINKIEVKPENIQKINTGLSILKKLFPKKAGQQLVLATIMISKNRPDFLESVYQYTINRLAYKERLAKETN